MPPERVGKEILRSDFRGSSLGSSVYQLYILSLAIRRTDFVEMLKVGKLEVFSGSITSYTRI